MSANRSITFFLADDHRLFADVLGMALEQQSAFQAKVVGTASNGAELLEQIRLEIPDILLLDLNMPVMNGLDAIPVLRAEHPDLRIIVVTNYSEPRFVRECIVVHHVDAYVHKTGDFEELLRAIRCVIQGQFYISKSLQLYPKEIAGVETVISPFEEPFQTRYKLTRRELEILGMIGNAKNNSEIAEGLFISPQTVGAHRKNIMRKLNISSAAGLVRFAIENQLG